MYESGTAYEDETFEFPGATGQWESGQWESGQWESEEEGENESLETELAYELLEVTSEEELDRFLGKLARSAFKGASAFVKSPAGKALGGVLKNVAKTALPMVGGAIGSFVAPGVGTAIGTKLGSLAGGLLEVGEAETMSEEEAQFESARRYVRFARSAYGSAAMAPRTLPARSVARAASVSAARQYAPSLLRTRPQGPSSRGRSGGTRRRGRPWGYAPAPTWAYDPQPSWAYPQFISPQPDGDGADDEPPTSFHDSSWSGDQESAATGGRWVRRGGRIVVLGA